MAVACRTAGHLRRPHETALPTLLGIVFWLLFHSAHAQSSSESVTFAVHRFTVTGPNPLSAARTASLLSRHLGPSLTLEELRAAAENLERAIRETGFAFYRVIIPAQQIDEGLAELRVVAFPVDSITVSPTTFHSGENIRRTLPGLEVGVSPNVRKLQRSLAIANRNPSKQSQVTFYTDEETGLLASIRTREQKTRNGLVWANDTGLEQTGENRIGVAFQHNNLFDRDHNLTVSFGTSLQQSENVQQYSAGYQLPLYRIGALTSLYAIRSDVDTGQVADFFNVSGRGDFVGGDVAFALPWIGRYKQFLVIGVDDRRFENDIDFEGEPIGVDVRSRPVSLRHTANWRIGAFSGSTYAGLYRNVESGAGNDDLSYALTRAGASPGWSAVRLGGQLQHHLGQWTLSGRVDAQYTADALIPGEQFGVGGLNSLRGIDQRQLTGDRGLLLSAELAPPLLRTAARELYAFLDSAYLDRIDALPGELDSETVTSTGAGVRWTWRQRLNLTLEYGYVVDGTGADIVDAVDTGDSRFHFQLLGRI